MIVPHGTALHPKDGHLIIITSSPSRNNHDDRRHLLESSSTTVEDHNLHSHTADDVYLTSPHESV